MVEKKTNEKKSTNYEDDSNTNNNNESLNVVVLKLDMHCEGCVNKIVKCAKSMQGVECAKPETEASKLTVVGKVDPLKLKEKLEFKTKKKVDLITPPLPKKDKDNNGQKNPAGSNKDNNGNNKKNVQVKKTEEKKAKEPQVTTAVLKVALHCQGCIDKINRIVTRFKGVLEMTLDKQNDMITVKGTMDAKALAETLKERLKRAVQIVPPPKSDNDKEEKKKKKKKNEKNGGEEKEENGGKKENKENGKEKENGGGKIEENKMEYMVVPTHYGYSPYVYGYPGYIEHLHAPQMFSDENPNACSIM